MNMTKCNVNETWLTPDFCFCLSHVRQILLYQLSIFTQRTFCSDFMPRVGCTNPLKSNHYNFTASWFCIMQNRHSSTHIIKDFSFSTAMFLHFVSWNHGCYIRMLKISVPVNLATLWNGKSKCVLNTQYVILPLRVYQSQQ